MKRFIAGIVACTMILSGCSNTKVETEHRDTTSMFVCVEDTDIKPWKVVYHKDTKVMYAVSDGGSSYGIFTLLVTPDGTPMIWEGEK